MADPVRRPLCAWSLADRMSPTRPTLVPCTLVVRRWASSLRHSPPGCTDCAAELVKRRLPFAPFAPRPRTTAHNPHDLAPRWKAPGARTTTKQQQSPTRPEELDDDETTKDPSQQGRKRHSSPRGRKRPCVLRTLLLLPSSASLLPVFCSAPLPALAGMFPKGGVP